MDYRRGFEEFCNTILERPPSVVELELLERFERMYWLATHRTGQFVQDQQQDIYCHIVLLAELHRGPIPTEDSDRMTMDGQRIELHRERLNFNWKAVKKGTPIVWTTSKGVRFGTYLGLNQGQNLKVKIQGDSNKFRVVSKLDTVVYEAPK